jgi:hypothetical protein
VVFGRVWGAKARVWFKSYRVRNGGIILYFVEALCLAGVEGKGVVDDCWLTVLNCGELR